MTRRFLGNKPKEVRRARKEKAGNSHILYMQWVAHLFIDNQKFRKFLKDSSIRKVPFLEICSGSMLRKTQNPENLLVQGFSAEDAWTRGPL